MVGHPGASPGVSRFQAERIDVFLVPDKNYCRPQDLPCAAPRFRRDLHPLMTRSTTVRLDCFGFGTLARQMVGVGGNAPLVDFRHVLRRRIYSPLAGSAPKKGGGDGG